MTQHIRELLDDAVARVQPRVTDPVPAVIRRARVQRLRVLVAGATACAVLVGGGVAVAAWPARERVAVPPMATPVSGTPPTPRLVDGKIVAGGVVIPVPAGMRVVTPDWPIRTGQTSGCDQVDNAVAISGPDTQGCAISPIEIYGRPNPYPPGTVADLGRTPAGGTYMNVTAPRMITLAGGEPAFLQFGPDNNPFPGGSNTLVLPWEQLFIYLRVGGATQQGFIDSLQTTPEHNGLLVLPANPGFAQWSAPDRKVRPVAQDYGRTTDPNTIAAVLRLLGQQSTVLDNQHACAAATQPTARLTFDVDDPMARPVPPPASELPPNTATSIIISLAADCREAVSSAGGRVQLSAAALAELQRLFGVQPR